MKEFRCTICNMVFEAEGKSVEYVDFTFGPCKKWVANCPDCENEASEFKRPSQKKEGDFMPACGNPAQVQSCGGCCGR